MEIKTRPKSARILARKKEFPDLVFPSSIEKRKATSEPRKSRPPKRRRSRQRRSRIKVSSSSEPKTNDSPKKENGKKEDVNFSKNDDDDPSNQDGEQIEHVTPILRQRGRPPRNDPKRSERKINDKFVDYDVPKNISSILRNLSPKSPRRHISRTPLKSSEKNAIKTPTPTTTTRKSAITTNNNEQQSIAKKGINLIDKFSDVANVCDAKSPKKMEIIESNKFSPAKSIINDNNNKLVTKIEKILDNSLNISARSEIGESQKKQNIETSTPSKAAADRSYRSSQLTFDEMTPSEDFEEFVSSTSRSHSCANNDDGDNDDDDDAVDNNNQLDNSQQVSSQNSIIMGMPPIPSPGKAKMAIIAKAAENNKNIAKSKQNRSQSNCDDDDDGDDEDAVAGNSISSSKNAKVLRFASTDDNDGDDDDNNNVATTDDNNAAAAAAATIQSISTVEDIIEEDHHHHHHRDSRQNHHEPILASSEMVRYDPSNRSDIRRQRMEHLAAEYKLTEALDSRPYQRMCLGKFLERLAEDETLRAHCREQLRAEYGSDRRLPDLKRRWQPLVQFDQHGEARFVFYRLAAGLPLTAAEWLRNEDEESLLCAKAAYEMILAGCDGGK